MTMRFSREIVNLLKQRNQARKDKDYQKSDDIRQELEKLGYQVTDKTDTSELKTRKKDKTIKSGLVAIFGSGETSPTGRRVHEYLIKNKKPPVKIALLETPAGFEENPRHWYGKLADMLEAGLTPFQPQICFVEALKKDGNKCTNNEETLKELLTADYIHTGAGSPTYTVNHLKNSLAYKYLLKRLEEGIPLSFASAAAIAMGEYCLPVYEIYKVGEELHWKKGLNLFNKWGFLITIVPHWNNQEGGKNVDTSRCFMGINRFEKLLAMLPEKTCILGVDEQTACIFDFNKKEILVMGNGGVTIMQGKDIKKFSAGDVFLFSVLQN